MVKSTNKLANAASEQQVGSIVTRSYAIFSNTEEARSISFTAVFGNVCL